MDSSTIGLDLGTCNCHISTILEDGIKCLSVDYSPSIPFVMTITKDKITYGNAAKNRLQRPDQIDIFELKTKWGEYICENNDNESRTSTQSKQYGYSDKRVISFKNVCIPHGYMYQEEVYSLFIRNLITSLYKQYNLQIKRAIIAVPDYFNIVQVHKIVQSAIMSGLSVSNVISETYASVLGCYDVIKDKNRTMIINVGANSCHTCITERQNNKITILQSYSVPDSGGIDFDNALANLFCNKYYQLKKEKITITSYMRTRLEKYKLELVEKDSIVIPIDYVLNNTMNSTLIITKSEYQTACQSAFSKIITICNTCLGQIPVNSLDMILLIGGASHTLGLIETLHHYYKIDKTKIIKHKSPEDVVANGTYKFGQYLQNSLDVSFDCSTHSFSNIQWGTNQYELKINEDINLMELSSPQIPIYYNYNYIGFIEIPLEKIKDYTNENYRLQFVYNTKRNLELMVYFKGRQCIMYELQYDSDIPNVDSKYITNCNRFFILLEHIAAIYSNEENVKNLYNAWKEKEVTLMLLHGNKLPDINSIYKKMMKTFK